MVLSTLFFQSHIDQWLYTLGGLGALTLFYLWFWKWVPIELRFFVESFICLYGLIVVLGGIVVGVSEADWLLQLQPQGGYRVLSTEKISWPLYWFLLFLPLFLFPMALTAVHKILRGDESHGRNIEFRMDHLIFLFLSIVFLLSFHNYPARRFVDWILGGGDFSQMIRQRGQVLSGMNYFSLNIYYVLAPAYFSVICLKLFKEKKWFHFILVPLTLFLILTFTVLTYQKLLFFMTILLTGGLLFYRKAIPAPLLLAGAAAMPAILVLASLFSNNPFKFVEVFSHFILRTGSAISYYVAYISQSYYFPGYDMPLDGRSIKDNVDVFRFMFPVSSWKGGTSSAPFHLRAYFQGGLLFVGLEFLLVGLLVNGLQRLGNRMLEGQVYFEALALVFFFYLCQTSLKDCLVSSYGMILTTLFFIFILDLNRRIYGKSN